MITAAEATALYLTAINKEAEIVLEKIDAEIRKASANKLCTICCNNDFLNSVVINTLKEKGYTLTPSGNFTRIEWPTK